VAGQAESLRRSENRSFLAASLAVSRHSRRQPAESHLSDRIRVRRRRCQKRRDVSGQGSVPALCSSRQRRRTPICRQSPPPGVRYESGHHCPTFTNCGLPAGRRPARRSGSRGGRSAPYSVVFRRVSRATGKRPRAEAVALARPARHVQPAFEADQQAVGGANRRLHFGGLRGHVGSHHALRPSRWPSGTLAFCENGCPRGRRLVGSVSADDWNVVLGLGAERAKR